MEHSTVKARGNAACGTSIIGKIFQAGRNLSRPAAGLMILLAGLLIHSEAQAQLRIMPLGDSITEGAKSSDNAGYRSWLTDLYFPGQAGNPNDNFQCDFVGSISTGPDSMVDKQHEGWAGQNATFIRNNVSQFLRNNPPQVVFLMIGANDITDNVDPGVIRNTIGAILDSIYNFNNQIEIYLGEVSTRADAKQSKVVELNSALIGLVSGKKANGYDVTLVDMDLSSNKIDADGVHPNDRGYQEIALAWFSALEARHSPSPMKFTDDFQRTSLGSTNWAAHPDMQIQGNQLVNTSSEDNFNFMAVAKNLVNPRVISFDYGSNSNELGRAFTGLAVMLDKNQPDASGYLIFFKSNQNPGLIRLYEIANGMTGIGSPIDDVESLAPAPEPGDQLQVEITRDAQGHKFTVTVNTKNGIYSSTLRDPNRVQGRGAKLYSGVMINGATNNGVDEFVATTESDLVSPGDITNLQFKSASSSAITFSFNAPGDDGNIGAASSYDVRYSSGPITGNNFGNAQRVTGVKNPSSAGTEETITIGGLDGDTEYYIAVKAFDEVGNASKIAGGGTPFKTAALASKTDRFERTVASGLGKDWAASAGLRIVSGTVQNNSVNTQFAVLKTRQNIVEASLKLGAQATIPGGREVGILVMASDSSATPNGYVIRRLPPNGSNDRIGLFQVQNGIIVSEIQSGSSLSGLAPQAGSVIFVEYVIGETNVFNVYINGVLDRILEDAQKLENGKFAGFMLEGLGNPAENAVEEFSVAVPIKPPASLSKISGDNQIGAVEQPLENELVVKLIDVDNNPVSGKAVNFSINAPDRNAKVETPRATDGGIRVEAEAGVVAAPTEIRDDVDASRGKYVAYPNVSGPNVGVAMTFQTPSAGDYRIWTRSRRNQAPAGRWTVKVDNGAGIDYVIFDGNVSTTWEWDVLKNPNTANGTFSLNTGSHTIEFIVQRPETWLDKILVTSNLNFTPNGLEDPGFTTDVDGFARAQIVFGGGAGAITISAKHATLPAVSFTATASGGAAGSITKTSGDAQTGAFGKDLGQPFAVTVKDNGGNVVANHKVSWVITVGDGKLSNYVSTTDINGKATTTMTLGIAQAVNKVEARSLKQDGTSLGTIVFTGTASGGQPTKMVRDGNGQGQSGRVRTALPVEVAARVTDTNSTTNVPNVPLRFTVQRGGGSLSASVDLQNGSFELDNSGFPGNWSGENTPTGSEVQLSTNDPKAGTRSLAINSSRTAEVGVSQSIKYAANTNYILTFWAKVTNGTARVIWQVNDAAGNVSARTADIHRSGPGNTWVKYRLIETNFKAGNKPLLLVTDARPSTFFIDDVQIVPATNNSGRLATVWTLGDTAGAQQLAVTGIVGGPALTGSPLTFNATATAGAAAQLKVNTGNNQVGSVNQQLPLPFVAKVTDNTGINGVGGIPVKFTVKAGNGKLEGNVTTLTKNTDGQGLAQVIYTLGPTNNVPNTIEASATGLNPAAVNFTATAAVPGSFAVSGGRSQRASAGRPIGTPLAITIKTSDNQPIAGYPVKFEVIQGGGTINKNPVATIFTDATGVARATLVCGTVANTVNQVRASATANSQNISGSPQTFSIRTYGLKNLKYESGDNQQGGVVGNFLPQPLVMSVQDSNNTGVPGQKVKFDATIGGGSFEGGGVSKEVTSDTLGRAATRYKLGTQPIENRITSTITPVLPGSPRVFKAAAQASAPDSLIKVSGDSLKGVVGNPMPVPFTVKVGDRFGNGVAGIDVIFKVIAGGGKINNQVSDTIRTIAEGKAQITLTLGTSTTGGQFNNVVEVRSSNGSIPLRNTPLRFYATATASRARALVTTGSRQTGRAGSALANPFSVRVNDASGNAVPDHPVIFRVTRGGGSFHNGRSDSTVFTNTNGVAALKLTLGGTILPDSQIVTVTSTDGSGPLTNSPARFVAFANAGFPSQVTSKVTASPSSVPADGVTEVTITVEVKDGFSNPVANETVIVEVTNPPNSIRQPTQRTNAQGKATAKLSSTKSGPKLVTAYIPSGIAIANGVTVQFSPLEANRISLRDGNNQTGNINTAVGEPLSVRVLDRNGNGVPNHAVTFRVHSGAGKMGNGANNQTVSSNADGNAEAYFIFGAAQGESQIRAESPGLINSPIIFLATAVERPAKNLVYFSGNEQSGIAGEVLAEPIVVKVTDANGKAVFNKTVNFQVTFGNGSLSGAGVPSNEYGEAKVTWTLGSQAGLNTVRASSEGLTGSPFDFSAQAIGGRACCSAPVLAVVKGPAGGQSGPIQVRVSDGLGNGIDGYTVNFELVQGTGTLTQINAITEGGGIATTRLNFDNVSGYRKVRAVAGNLAGSPITILVYAQSSSAISMAAVPRTNNQGGTIGKPLNFPLQIKLLDAFGNPALGEAVDFVVTSGGGSLNGGGAAVTAVSDSSGIAEARLMLGNGVGANRVNAVKKGGNTMPPVAFTATGFTNNFPIFSEVPDQKATELAEVEFTVVAADADGDGMSFGARNLPPGAAFDSLNTRNFYWRTNYNSAGVYEPEFLVRDGKGGIDIEVVRITVGNNNRPPIIDRRVPAGHIDPSKPDTTLIPGADGVARFTMRVFAHDEDPEDRLSYRWLQNGQLVGNNSNSFNFVGVLGLTYMQCVVSDGVAEVTTDWAVKVPVSLNTFSASAGSKAVTLRWSTSAEFNNVGFHVLRSSSAAGAYTRITKELIPPRRDGDYSFVDNEVTAGARYYYKLEDIDASGKSTLHGPVQAQLALPEVYELSQNYPNPFNPTTNIQFQLPKPGVVRLLVYNSLGQVVARLVNGMREAGYHTVLWNGRDLHGEHVPSGVYHYRLETEGYVMTKKMVLAK